MTQFNGRKGRKKLVFGAIITSLFFSGCHFGQEKSEVEVSRFSAQNWDALPSEAVLEAISKIETSVILPKQTDTIDSYVRFYAVGENLGERYLFAVFTDRSLGNYWDLNKLESLGPSHKNAFFVLGGNLPFIADGGCGVISIVYNLTEPLAPDEKIEVAGPHDWQKTSRVLAQCNGLA